MNGELTISKAQKFELDDILNLQRLCYQSEAALYSDYEIQPLTQKLSELIDDFDKGTVFLVGYIDGKLVASVRGHVKNGTGYINKLIVHTAVQNCGYGKRMMKAIEAELKEAKRYELFTGAKSKKNLALYDKLEYEVYLKERVSEALELIYLQKII